MKREKLRNIALKGVIASIFTGVVMYYTLRTFIVLTISIGPVDKLYSVSDFATIVSMVLAFITTISALYTSEKKLKILGME